MSEIEKRLSELNKAISLVFKKKTEYYEAVELARAKAEQLSEHCHKIINQPHITLDDCEV